VQPLPLEKKAHILTPDCGVVVIGRNEGERLVKCLDSVLRQTSKIVYVDSGSTDDSIAMAKAKGVDVIELNADLPFTAARARNEGYSRLQKLDPTAAFIQFVDGDCELAEGWIGKAATFLQDNKKAAIVCGRLREKNRMQTVYNMLCDIEWDAPAGESRACGGIAMIRSLAFDGSGGFRTDLVAGEEPELCFRLRESGWKVWRLEAEMAKHDAAMTHFSQWWKRAIRNGFANAHAAHLHGNSSERYGVRESRRAWIWAFWLPAAVIAGTIIWSSWSALLLMLYPLQIVRLAIKGPRTPHENWLHALFLVVGKFPELIGQLKFFSKNIRSAPAEIIEYK